MKFHTLCILLFIQGFIASAQKSDRLILRNAFQECVSKEKTESLHKHISDTKSTEVISIGYKGAVIAMRAKYSANPFKKYSYCKDGLNILTKAINQAPEDLELRYLRMIIESNIPSFLGMNCNLHEDKNMIIARIEQEKDLQLKRIIADFLLKSDICTDKEKKLLALK